MRKPFNVCLPVERGRQRETVIAEREAREGGGGRDGVCVCACVVGEGEGEGVMGVGGSEQSSQTDTPAHAV